MKQDRNFSMSKRSISPQHKIQKTHKLKKNPNTPSSSYITNSISHEKQSCQPKERKILNLIQELEAQQEKEISNQKLNYFCFEDSQQLVTRNEDQENLELKRQSQYNQYYNQEFQQSLISEYVYLGNSLSNHTISYQMRAIMVDWMIEIIGNYSETTSDATFFRSVSIMDYYLQKTIFQYSDNEFYLIGITSTFIATKLEDIYQIPLQDFVNKVSHNDYSVSKIKAMEQSILETLNFEITFPTALDFLQNIFYQCFSLNSYPYLQNILDASIYILKLCLHDYSMTSFNSYTLASSSLIYSITHFINQNYQKNQQIIINQFYNKLVQITQIDQIELNLCEKYLFDLIGTFQSKYPQLHNLGQFS